MMGEDKDNQLPKATELAKKYSAEDSEFVITKGTFVLLQMELENSIA